MSVLEGLQPAEVFSYFEKISAIPRGSGNTKAISDYLVEFAKEHELEFVQDETNNVVIFAKGTEGYEESSPVILQGHMDMVCEKEPGTEFDFENNGIELLQDGEFVTANGTTLGADDGIAVAYILAILASDSIPHPPIEAVITVDEEIGMLGAVAMDTSCLKGRRMLNIDSEDEGILLVSCAGGVTVKATLPVECECRRGYRARLTLTGLQGGHSGQEINKGRGNANVIMGRVLCTLAETVSFQLISVDGGLKDNAIPRETVCNLLLDTEGDVKELVEQAAVLQKDLAAEFAHTDPDIKLMAELAPEMKSTTVYTYESTAKVMTALFTMPNGVCAMSFAVPGLVETSLNLGIVSSNMREVNFSYLVRSSVESRKQAVARKLRCLMEALGGYTEESGSYPAWEYKEDSKLRDLMKTVFEKQYGREPKVESIHAGVECGLFCGKVPGLDVVSFGPDLYDIHTPKERMDIQSAARTWDYLLAVLKEMKE